MIEPAEFDPADTPSVTLAGKQWPMPELVIRQNRKVRRPLIEMNDRIRLANKDGAVFAELPEEDWDRLIVVPIYYGLTRAHPTLKLEEFLDWPATDEELVNAWFVLRDQSGVFLKPKDGAPGEALATEPRTVEVSRTSIA